MALTHLPGDEMTSDDAPRTTQRTLRRTLQKTLKDARTEVSLTQMHQSALETANDLVIGEAFLKDASENGASGL